MHQIRELAFVRRKKERFYVNSAISEEETCSSPMQESTHIQHYVYLDSDMHTIFKLFLAQIYRLSAISYRLQLSRLDLNVDGTAEQIQDFKKVTTLILNYFV